MVWMIITSDMGEELMIEFHARSVRNDDTNPKQTVTMLLDLVI